MNYNKLIIKDLPEYSSIFTKNRSDTNPFENPVYTNYTGVLNYYYNPGIKDVSIEVLRILLNYVLGGFGGEDNNSPDIDDILNF